MFYRIIIQYILAKGSSSSSTIAVVVANIMGSASTYNGKNNDDDSDDDKYNHVFRSSNDTGHHPMEFIDWFVLRVDV